MNSYPRQDASQLPPAKCSAKPMSIVTPRKMLGKSSPRKTRIWQDLRKGALTLPRLFQYIYIYIYVWKTLLQWMIWGYPYFGNHPYTAKQTEQFTHLMGLLCLVQAFPY